VWPHGSDQQQAEGTVQDSVNTVQGTSTVFETHTKGVPLSGVRLRRESAETHQTNTSPRCPRVMTRLPVTTSVQSRRQPRRGIALRICITTSVCCWLSHEIRKLQQGKNSRAGKLLCNSLSLVGLLSGGITSISVYLTCLFSWTIHPSSPSTVKSPGTLHQQTMQATGFPITSPVQMSTTLLLHRSVSTCAQLITTPSG
jgi:hypothetical protein